MSRTLIRSTAVTAGMTVLSRISGLIRDVVFARLIGAGIGVAADAFYVAFRIPNFLRRIFGEGAFSQAFVPVFAEYKTRGDEGATRAFLDHVAGVLGLALIAVTALGTLLAPLVILVLAPGFLDDPDKYALTVNMLRIMFPYLLFISLVAMAGGILNTFGRFGLAAFTPVLLNLTLIAAALWFAPRLSQPVIALAWGVFAAGVLQLAFQLPALKRLRLLPRPRFAFRDPGVRRVFKLMVPAVFSVSIQQINLLVNTLLASFLVTGSVAWLYYSDRLMEFPLGVFGVALGTVILPSLAQNHSEKSREEFSCTLDWALRVGLIISVPATVGLILLARPLLVTFFQYGAFVPHDVEMTARALIAFSLGLPAFVLVKILAPGFYARQDMRTPVRIGVIAVVANVALSLLLVWPLAHTGLALATSLAAMINAGLLHYYLRQHEVFSPLPGWRALLVKIVFASGLMGFALWTFSGDVALWFSAGVVERITRLAILVIIGIGIYVGAMYISGVRLQELMVKRVSMRKDRNGGGEDSSDSRPR